MGNDVNVDWDDFKLRHEAAVGYAQSALKSLVLVNGGAIISLLTFFGNKDVQVDKVLISYAFAAFGTGLTLALVAYGAAYFAQEGYLNAAASRTASEDPSSADKQGGIAIFAAVLCAFFGLCSFVVGSFLALDAIT